MKILLIIINIICAFIHLLFEVHIEDSRGIYSFVLVENLIVTFSFLLMAYLVFDSNRSIKNLYINFIFWLTFVIGVLLFKPTITTLQILKEYLFQIPQWQILFGFGIVTLFSNIAEIAKRIRKKTVTSL